MAPKRRLKEKRNEQQIGKEHGIEPTFDAKDDTSLKALRSSPRLREKELKQMEGKNKKKLENFSKVHDIGVDKKPANAKGKAEKKVDDAASCEEPQQVVGSSNKPSMVPLPYIEVFLPDGRLARQCRASDECDGRFRFETVRWRMERHLAKEHGLEVHIPLRKLGRPPKTELGSRDKAPQSRVEKVRWHKLAKKRYEDKDRKLALNMKKTEDLHRLRAKEKWAKLKPEFRTLPKEEFVEKIVKQRMSTYLASSRERSLRIQKRIDEGYEKHRRVKVLPAWLNVMMDDIEEEKKMHTKTGKEPEESESNEEAPSWGGKPCDMESSKEEESFDEQENEEFEKEEEKSNAPHSMDTLGGFTMMTLNIDVKNDEDVIMEHRQKLPIRRAKKTQVLIDLCSPSSPSHETRASHKFMIENGQVKVVEERDGKVVTSRASIAAARLGSNAEITFTSKRFKLSVGVDQPLVYGILHNEANSRTINLFGQWMEHILPSSILKKVYFVDALWYTMSCPVITEFLLEQFTGVDFSELVFFFWPVICRHHWSLFVLYVNRGLNLLGLTGKKHYLLYFDSLGLTSPFECLDSVQRALRCLAEIIGDVNLRHALLNIETELELKIVDAPQQPNGSDCGFYLMKYIRDLIAGGLEDRPCKSWLTKDWFEHKDVCQMKEELHDWCMRCLTEI